MSSLDALIETIVERTDTVFVTRKQNNYVKFLQLYEEVGYAPAEAEARAAWQQRSCNTWSQVDALLTGTTTGGMVSGEIVSSWGTLPLSPGIVYGHSVCMVKNLFAAATLFAQALHSLTWVETIPSIQYWAGSYAKHSTFTSLFQNPKNAEIPNQLELDVVRYVPMPTSLISRAPEILLVDVTDQHLFLLPTEQQLVFAELKRSHSLLSSVHSITAATVLNRADATPLALTLIQTAPPELTAANVYSWIWVFPLDECVEWPDLCRRLRCLDIFSNIPLQVVVKRIAAPFQPIENEKLIPSFWRFTPRTQLHLLRRSLQAAFESLLMRYSDDELKSCTAWFNSERGLCAQ